MRRAVLYTLLWLAAGGGALALGWSGVATVGNQVTGTRPSPLSADEVRDELALATSTTAAASPTTVASGSDSTATTQDDGRPSASTPPTVRDDPSHTPTTTPAADSVPVTRSYVVRGGSVTLRFAPQGVTVQSATPNPGYTVEVETEEGNGVEVEFRNADLRSRVKGWWDGGPRDEVREDD